MNSTTSLLNFGPHHDPASDARTSLRTSLIAWTESTISPLCLSFCVTASSNALTWYRNINLLSIAYDCCPRLRPRLTSHFALATHAGILSPIQSTVSHDSASARIRCSPTDRLRDPKTSVYGLAPVHFLRIFTRPVSYYALFECVAASKPTSWLSVQLHIISHLTVT